MLRLEPLEVRALPAATTLADILPHYDPVTYSRPMPDVPADRVLVVSADLDPADQTNEIYDVFASHGGWGETEFSNPDRTMIAVVLGFVFAVNAATPCSDPPSFSVPRNEKPRGVSTDPRPLIIKPEK